MGSLLPYLWPFKLIEIPFQIVGYIRNCIEAAYWQGTRDGSLITAVVLIILYLLFSKPAQENK